MMTRNEVSLISLRLDLEATPRRRVELIRSLSLGLCLNFITDHDTTELILDICRSAERLDARLERLEKEGPSDALAVV